MASNGEPRRGLAKVAYRVMPNGLRRRAIRVVRQFGGPFLGPMSPASAYRQITKGYDHEDAACAAIRRIEEATGNPIQETTMLSYERLETLYEQVLFVERQKIPGTLVECGVWRGGAAAIMALACMAEVSAPRTIHLFDSFEGLPAPIAEFDGQLAVNMVGRGDGALVATGAWAAEAEAVRELIVDRLGAPAGFLTIHKGWFQDTLPVAKEEIGEIALLRLDGDFYDSTKVPLDNLYQQVTSGGIVVIDDYGGFEGCRRAVDEYLGANDPGVFLHHIDRSGRYLLKP